MGIESLAQPTNGQGAVALGRQVPRYVLSRTVDHWTRFRWRTRLRHGVQRLRYFAPADPWRRLFIDPQSLQRANYELSKYIGLGLIRDGAWDAPSNSIPIEEYWSVRGIRERFLEGRAWEDTSYYETARRQFEETGRFWEYDDLDTFVRERCGYIDELYRTIQEDGYRSNLETTHVVPESSFKQLPHQHLDVLVTIDRSGQLMLRDGHHRVTIAQLLSVDEIPVHVVGRHRQWQRTRDALARGGAHDEFAPATRWNESHPDLDLTR